ncbi:hypothetical protein HM1_3121 [Heliomicrobium modesticaldum Ice1]|uniref:Uncharacterized protein n=1 Tax=Heliobacterium modesticaldum (strain ATCC 51547 / Ice1) TaxID=498761 RepID=B0TEE0_HELMI|nr:hypothetical protein HM1_3121 [Heliomicrobium modesticaldum Ice1]
MFWNCRGRLIRLCLPFKGRHGNYNKKLTITTDSVVYHYRKLFWSMTVLASAFAE